MSKVRIPQPQPQPQPQPHREGVMAPGEKPDVASTGMSNSELLEGKKRLEVIAQAAISLPPGVTSLEHTAHLLKVEGHPEQGQVIHSYTFTTATGDHHTFSVPDPQVIFFGEPPRITPPGPTPADLFKGPTMKTGGVSNGRYR